MPTSKDLIRSVVRLLPWRAIHSWPPAAGGSFVSRHYFASIERYPRHGVVRTVYGFKFRCDTTDVIQRAIYVYGVWEPDISAWVTEFLHAGDVVLDVGANTGYFSLVCSAAVGRNGTVIAVEPVPSIATLASSNFDLNTAAQIDLQRIALGRVSGQVEIFRSSPDNIGNSATIEEPGSSTEGSVPRMIGDQLLGRLTPGQPPRLIKIDTEGDEAAVLEGLTATLEAMAPGSAVLVEITPEKLALRDLAPKDVIEILPQTRWSMYQVRNDYDFARYKKSGPPALLPLLQVPDTRMDVVFVKL